MPIFHVETKTDFLFFEGSSRDSVIKYCKSKNMKLNAVNFVDRDLYNTLLEAEFIKQAEIIKE